MNEPIELPPGPRCKRCGHEPCPMCQTWCDDLDCECDSVSECILDPLELKTWLSLIKPLLEKACREGCGVVSTYTD